MHLLLLLLLLYLLDFQPSSTDIFSQPFPVVPPFTVNHFGDVCIHFLCGQGSGDASEISQHLLLYISAPMLGVIEPSNPSLLSMEVAQNYLSS